MSNATTREKFLNAAKGAFRTRAVTVAGVEVLVRSPSVEQSTLLAQDGDQGKKLVGIALRSCLDPATHQPLFTPADEAALLEAPMEVLKPLLEAFGELVSEGNSIPKA